MECLVCSPLPVTASYDFMGGGVFAGFTEGRKQFLYFKRLSAAIYRIKRGFVFFLFCLFYTSTYVSSDARWRNSRQFLSISWFETSHDCSACTIKL